MDGFADGMTARGPTLGTERRTWTGSLHVVDLPGPKAVREFVAREPYNQAGLFEEHFIWRFANFLGPTMWQFAGAADAPRFLVLAQVAEDLPKDPRPVPVADLPPQLRERLIVYGSLRNLDDEELPGWRWRCGFRPEKRSIRCWKTDWRGSPTMPMLGFTTGDAAAVIDLWRRRTTYVMPVVGLGLRPTGVGVVERHAVAVGARTRST